MFTDKWIEKQHYLLTGRDTLPGDTHQPGRPDQETKSKDMLAVGTMPNILAKLTDSTGSHSCLQILQPVIPKPDQTKQKNLHKQKPLPSMNHSLTGKELRLYSTILWKSVGQKCDTQTGLPVYGPVTVKANLTWSSWLKGSAEQTQASLGHTFLLPTLMDRKARHSNKEWYMHTERPSDAPMQPIHSLFVVQITTAE